MTTSWGTSTDKFPATLTVLPNGIFQIKSTSAVDAEDRVEIYTDGTMAYVVHDLIEKDQYVMDKRAEGAANNSFAHTEDGHVTFGGVMIANDWKYFIVDNGAYSFGVNVTLQYGASIDTYGAIFDITYGGNDHTYRCTTAAAGEGAYGTIEAYNLTITTYTGPNGSLTVGMNGEEFIFARLNGNDLFDCTLNGNILTVPGEGETVVTTEDGPKRVKPATAYTLSSIARTYTAADATVETDLFHVLTGNTGTYQTTVGADGNLWAMFKCTAPGKLTVRETIQVPEGSASGDDTYMSIFDLNTMTGSSFTSTYHWKGEDDGYQPVEITDAELIAGHVYVIKAGSYDDRTKSYDGTGSEMEGETEAIQWTFTPFASQTLTGDQGDLLLYTDGGVTKSIILNGQVLTGLTQSGNTYTAVVKTFNVTNPADPIIHSEIRTITVDLTAGTYTVVDSTEDQHPFHVMGATETSYSANTGSDGQIWAVYVPASNGFLTITETHMGVSDSYLQFFELTANSTVDDLKSANAIAKVDFAPVKLSNLTVIAGHTYVIKLGAWATRDALPEDGSAALSNVGCLESFSIEFEGFSAEESYTGADGDLTIAFKDDEFYCATLAGDKLTGRVTYDETAGTLTVASDPTYDTTTNPLDPTETRDATVFTLDSEAGTYVKNATSVTEPVIKTLTETSTGLSGFIGSDGSIWARFSPTTDGYISIDETVQATNGTGKDTLLSVYEELATSTLASYIYYSSTTSNSQTALNYTFQSAGADNGSSPVYVHNMPVEGGHTYIIKIGAYGGNANTIGDTLSSTYTGYIGSPEAFSFSFGAKTTETYTGTEGTITIEKKGDELAKATLGTTAMVGAELSADGTTLTVPVGTATINATTDPMKPTVSVTTKTYTLAADGTYTVSQDVATRELCHELTGPTEVYTAGAEKNGCTYSTFEATADGVMTVEETLSVMASGGYLYVYEMVAGTAFASYSGSSATSSNHLVGYLSATLTNNQLSVEVKAGHKYLIVAGASNYTSIVSTSTTSTYAGKPETVTMTFTPYATQTFTGVEGDLVIKTLGGEYKGATIDNKPVTGNVTVSDDGATYSVSTGAVLSEDGDPAILHTADSYTLDFEAGTYTVAATSSREEVVQGTLTAPGTLQAVTKLNGMAVMKFVPEADGNYDFSALISGVDGKVGIYTDRTLTTALASRDNGLSNAADTVTYECVAGTTYYIKTSYYSDFNKGLLTTASASYQNKNVTFTVALH